MRVLVVGATGFLGLHALDALAARGLPATAGHRRAASLLLRKRGVATARVDLDAPEGLADALRGHEIVVHAAAHYPSTSLDRQGAVATALRQTRALLDACAAARVRRLVVISSVATVRGRPDGPSTEADRWPHAPGIGAYHDTKWAIEELVLSEDRFEVRVACPGACIGPWDLRIGTVAPLVALAHGRPPPLPDGVVNLVDARDVGAAAAELALRPSAPGRVILSARSERLHPWLASVARRYGAPPPPRITAAEAEALADAAEARSLRTGERAIPARELVDLVVHGVPVDASLASGALGLSFSPIERALDDFDAWARRLRILPPPPELEVRP